MNEVEQTVKRRSIYRRNELAPGRYVRFERDKDERLTEISTTLGIETAEVVRIAVDELFERKALQVLMNMKLKAAKRSAPKGVAVPRTPKAVEYIPIEDMVTA